jgi:hypothetical protein
MENFSYHVPFYVVNGGVATAGHSADLKPGQIGLFDRNTFSVATALGNGRSSSSHREQLVVWAGTENP